MDSGPTSRGDSRSSPGPARPGSWVTRGLRASVQGTGLAGLILAEAGMLCVLALWVSFATVWFGLLLIPGTVLAIRRLANLTRRLSGEWCGVDIAVPYLPQPTADGAELGLWRRFGWLLTDQATWRDLLWMFVDSCAGWIFTILPIGVVGYGLYGVIMPAVWSPIVHAGGNQWYAWIDVKGLPSAWLCLPLGVAFVALGLWVGPRALSSYGRFARLMLAPTRQAELALRVRHLTASRSDVVDTRAAEIRRIERDLHDGAQARLVAMGMTLGAAERVLDDNPAAARALLIEARDSSAKALAELRDLVRGIHPPVLADRGLGDAIRALAMDTPMRIHLVADLPGRPDAPVESAAYFAVCELLANVAKHAQAREIWIDLRYERGLLRIDVTDDGHGGADASRGGGLSGIERRLAAFDGILALSSPPGGPTVVTMELPCVLSSPKTSSS